jgi:hypothetical protein
VSFFFIHRYLLPVNISLILTLLLTAYRHESAAYNATVEYFSLREENTAWLIPVLIRVSNDLRIVSQLVSTIVALFNQ